MRETKYRAWDKMTLEMKVVKQIHFDYKEVIFDDYKGTDITDWKTFDDCELMQYIGLNDKNNKEIYEFDIVNGCCFNGSYAYGKVVYLNDSFVVYPIGKFLEGISDIYYNLNHIEVIGNVFENPELLK